ncbi:hypothetical protein ACHQM5_029163 [Ranunculus cassubicifolius]
MDQINQFFGGGEAKEQPKPESAMPTMEGVKEKCEYAIQKSHETAIAAKDKVFAATATEPKPKENEGGFMQNAGAQVMGAAGGAANAVKGAFGMNGTEAEKK